MKTAKHVLRMSLVALPPSFVVQFIYQARAVVALVEGDGDETAGGFAGAVGLYTAVLGVDDFGGERGHFGGSLEAWVEEPETCC